MKTKNYYTNFDDLYDRSNYSHYLEALADDQYDNRLELYEFQKEYDLYVESIKYHLGELESMEAFIRRIHGMSLAEHTAYMRELFSSGDKIYG